MTKNEALKEIAAGLKRISAAVQSLIEPEAEQPSLEDVRKVLAEISRSGKTAEMKSLLEQFGAQKLSDIAPEKYSALLAAAKESSNA